MIDGNALHASQKKSVARCCASVKELDPGPVFMTRRFLINPAAAIATQANPNLNSSLQPQQQIESKSWIHWQNQQQLCLFSRCTIIASLSVFKNFWRLETFPTIPGSEAPRSSRYVPIIGSVSLPQRSHKNERNTYFQQKFAMGSYGVGIRCAWYLWNTCKICMV